MIIDGENDGDRENDFAAFEQQANQEKEPADPKEKDDKEAPDPEDEEDSEDTETETEDEEDSEDEETEAPKPKKTASERIKELNRKLRETERAREVDRKGFEARLERIEKGDLTQDNSGGNQDDARVAPDPKDQEKYPLGSLDDRYIQDAIDFKAEEAAKRMVDSLLQRQEQSAEQEAAEKLISDLRSRADDVAAKGSEIHDDYQEVVLEAGLRGEYDLTQVTFEAAAEAEHGAMILYGLATDPKEASRVANLSPFQQLKYVSEKNAEIAKGGSGRRIPKAGNPPDNSLRGRSKRTTISPATQNFEEFERLANM